MRILTLRFQNLNSLQGEWAIDFRHAAYADEGIFAITGSTGAGKTTILDAICLALYGATPRLGEITQTKNDLMSRHTGECYAEVVFSTAKGNFRCHWAQKRAYKKPDGKLQSPKHEMSIVSQDDDNGKLIEEKAQQTKLRVEAVTGMDFDRFTRAMLLAQGSFSAFLQASSDERSPILEQITGTAIYTDISKKAHILHGEAKRELENLTNRLSGMHLLSIEEESQLRTQQAALAQAIDTDRLQLQHTEQAKNWRQQLNDIDAKLTQLQHDHEQLTHEKTAFTPQQQRLHRALQAQMLNTDYQQLIQLRQQYDHDQNEWQALNQQRPIIEQRYQDMSEVLATSKANYHAKEQQWQQAQPLFKQVRDYDSQINQQQHYIHDIQNQLQQSFTQTHALKLTINQLKHAITAQQAEAKKLAEQQPPFNLNELPQTVATLAQLATRFDELQQQQQSIYAAQHEQQHAKQEAVSHSSELTEQLKQLAHQKAQLAQQFQQTEQALQQLTQGQSSQALREQYETTWQRQNHVATLRYMLQDWQQYSLKRSTLQQDLLTLSYHLNDSDTTLANLQKQHQQAKQHIELINKNLILISKIASLEAERQRLQPGCACPLCGATEHPYVHQQLEQPDETQLTLIQAEHELDRIETALQQALVAQTSLKKDQTQTTEQLALVNEQLTAIYQSIYEISQAILPILPADWQQFLYHADMPLLNQPQFDFLNTSLTQLQQQLVDHSETLQQAVTQHDSYQQTLQSLNYQLQEINNQHHRVSQQQLLADTKLAHSKQQLHDLSQQLNDNAQRQQQLANQLAELFSPYQSISRVYPDATPLCYDSHETLLTSIQYLQQQLTHWQTQAAMQQQLQDAIVKQQHELAIAKSQLDNQQQNQTKIQQQLNTLEQRLQTLQTTRFELFCDKNVDTEEQHCQQQRQAAYEQWQQHQSLYQNLAQEYTHIQSQLHTTEKTLAQQQDRLQQADTHIHQRLDELGFADEAEYQRACLSDGEREQLHQQAHTLQERQRFLAQKQQEYHEQQQLLASQTLTDATVDELNAHMFALQSQLDEAQKQLGAIEQQLASNDDTKARQQHLFQAIEQQRQHYQEWQQLHELIGSSDGKKFRNFAQGLTFNIMIAHANEQLKKMSDRYLLLADQEQPLMLSVMDNYQGGQIRTSKNLSGGESFIISLALALGLSTMASHRMQVDSLFLDEGFGTLDEEALDVALDTLTALQRSGKLIGVISHIQALKERISSQIQVQALTGGVSYIKGAGIKKVS